MKCENCNNVIDQGYNVCPYCGAPVRNVSQQNTSINQPSPNMVNNVNPGVSNPNVVNNVNPSMPTQNVQPQSIPNVQPQNIPNVQQQSMNVNVQNNTNFNKPKKSNTGLIVAIVLIIAIIGSLVGAMLYFSSSKQVFSAMVKKVTNPLIETVGKDYDSFVTTFDLSTNAEFEQNSDMAMFNDLFNNISLSGKVGLDYKNKLAYMEFDGDYTNEEILSAKMYFEDSKGYAYLNNIFDKYISVDIDGYDDIFAQTDLNDELESIIKGFRDSLNKSLKSDYFTKTKVNGLSKHTLVLNQKNFSEITVSMFKYLKENDEFISSAASISEMDKQEIIDMLNDSIEEIESVEEYDTEEIIEISIYTKGLLNKFAKFEISMESEQILIYLEKEDKEDYVYGFETAGTEMLTGKLHYKDGKETELGLTVELDGMSLGFDLTYNVEYDEKIEKVDVSNSVNVENLTETDANSILEKLSNNKGLKALLEELEELGFDGSSMEDGFGDSYDYDYGDNYGTDSGTTLDYFGDAEVTVVVPTGAEVSYKGNTYLTYEYNDIRVETNLSYFTDVNGYFEQVNDIDIKVIKDMEYKNINLSEMKQKQTSNGTFYYKDLSYQYVGYSTITYYEQFYCIPVGNNVFYTIELSSTTPISSSDVDMILQFN